MGSLSIALANTAQAQRTITKAINVLQANIANVNTSGYAVQRPGFENEPFNPDVGLPGGIRFGGLQDSRSTYAEEAVRDQQGFLNQNQQLATDLEAVNPAFDLKSGSSVPEALSTFFNSFSQLAVKPNDILSRQKVLDAAAAATQSFKDTATKLGDASGKAGRQITETVDAINADVTAIQNLNLQRRNSPESQHDAGLDSQVYAKLEELSQYANIQTLRQPDGTVNIYLAGQTALLVGTHQYQISATASANSTAIVDANNRDITSQINSGKLAGLLQERNTLLPSYTANLNTLAQTFADTVNGQLRQGVDANGASPSIDLFSYDPVAGAASTLQVSGLQTDQIAAATPAAPGGNGNALALSQLSSAKSVNGLTFSEDYGSIAGRFGQDLSTAQTNVQSGQNLLVQAQQNRQNISGVSLDEQAAQLVQFQQSYQAAGDLFRVLNQLAQDTLNLIQ